HHALERILFVAGITLYGFNEIRNQVVTALELHVNLRPGVFRFDASAYQAVVDHDNEAHDYHGDNQKDPNDSGGRSHGTSLQRSNRRITRAQARACQWLIRPTLTAISKARSQQCKLMVCKRIGL